MIFALFNYFGTVLTRPIHGGNLDWAVSHVNCPLKDIVDFSASINPLGPPPSAIAAINSGISQLKHYPNPDYPFFREVIADKHQLTSDWVLPTNGAAELFTWIAWEAHNLQAVLLPAPCFADYKRALSTFKVNFTSYSLSSLEQGLEIKEKDKLALLINNPHNPTGKLWSRQTLQSYLNDFALVIVDEARTKSDDLSQRLSQFNHHSFSHEIL